MSNYIERKDPFVEDYHFCGKHAEMVRQLCRNEKKDRIVFSTYVDLFICSAVVGCVLDKKVKRDTRNRDGNNTANILASAFTSHSDVRFVYCLVLICGDQNTASKTERLDRAFRYRNTKNSFSIFEEYMLGGLEYLYRNFMENNQSSNDQMYLNLRNLMSTFIPQVDNVDCDDDIFD